MEKLFLLSLIKKPPQNVVVPQIILNHSNGLNLNTFENFSGTNFSFNIPKVLPVINTNKTGYTQGDSYYINKRELFFEKNYSNRY